MEARNEQQFTHAKHRRTRVLLPSGVTPFRRRVPPDIRVGGKRDNAARDAARQAGELASWRYGVVAVAAAADGIANWKTLPCPGSLVAQMRPP